MRKLVIGIDPGIHGAVGVLELHEDRKFSFVDVFDMPLKLTPNGKNRIDLYQLSNLLERYTSETVLAVIEEVGFMKGNEARGTAFTFGYATGAVTGILAGLMVTIHTVTPSIWKLSMGIGANKASSITLIKSLLPASKDFITLKKHDGRAEALLLGIWGIRNMGRSK